jgi:uncharacterized membrane protein YphA (DoxX/SURF4 family)
MQSSFQCSANCTCNDKENTMNVVELVGRLVFAGLFLAYGIQHFTQFSFFRGYAKAKGTPLPGLAVAGTGGMLLAGGSLVALGAWADLGAAILVAFLVPVAFAIHPFWVEHDPVARAGEQAAFLKDIGLAGAALLLVALVQGGAAYALTGPAF